MGYEASLDGIRAVSVMAVICYHAGFSWMHGGFFGVEVFFVVSGYLITSLLIAERRQTGRISLRGFWHRRWRRLLPALFTMLIAVSLWAVFWGSPEQQVQLRRDLPWGVFYAANWGQIVGHVPYFAPSPPLLRHLWSLAVEEQWYLVWPLVFVAITARRHRPERVARGLAVVSLAIMAGTALTATVADLTTKTTNFLYLSTLTRSTGLLLGAALAFVWQPWRHAGAANSAPDARARSRLDLVGLAAGALIVMAFLVGSVVHSVTYQVVLPLVTVASTVLVAVAVHPWATASRAVLSARPLVAVGRRSYGLYLWSWPISRICGAVHGSVGRFVGAMMLTAIVNEACYRWIESPARRGALGRWWGRQHPQQRRRVLASGTVTCVAVLAPLALFYRDRPESFDLAVDRSGDDVTLDVTLDTGTDGADPAADDATGDQTGDTAAGNGGASPSPAGGTTAGAATPGTAPVKVPRIPKGVMRLVVVGDSQAHSLVVNQPRGTNRVLKLFDGAVSGCGVYEGGHSGSKNFASCRGFAQKWADDVKRSKAKVALVMIGAWDVMSIDGERFGSAAFDQRFTAGLQKGIDALVRAGARVALLEVACMRPVQNPNDGVPYIAERGDDHRTAHLNDLMRQVAAKNARTTKFFPGPTQWCTDPKIATSLAYRWDGVHVYKAGSKLILEAIAKPLVAWARGRST